MGWDEGRLRAAAGADYGLLVRGSAQEAGLSDATISRRVGAERWNRVAPGVYYLNATPPTWNSQVRRATLAAGSGALASHRTAAKLWRLDGVETTLIELTVPYEDGPVPSGFIVHRTRRPLERAEVTTIPVTTVERTILDLAGMMSEAVVEKALTSALGLDLTTTDAVARLITDQGGRGVRGTNRARRVLQRVDDDLTGSPSEVDLLSLIRSAAIPRPECQHQIKLPSGHYAYPDFAWPSLMRLVEVDGLHAHASADALHNDLHRQNMLMQLGWEIRRFSARAVHRDPKGVLAEIVAFVNH